MLEHEIPSDLKYTKTHEWVRRESDGTMYIGITHHAQSLLGDLVHVELPDVDVEIKAGHEVGVVESVKAASDLYCPISGEIIAVNEALIANPELLNHDPYIDGWIFQMEPTDIEEFNELLNATEYEQLVNEEH